MIGAYEMLVKNKKSIRIRFTSEKGTMYDAIISSYRTNGYRAEGATKNRVLPKNHLCITWDNGEQKVIEVKDMVNRIVETSNSVDKEMIQAIYGLCQEEH